MGLLIIRIGLGVCFAFHGWPKISGGPVEWATLGNYAHMPHPRAMGLIGSLVEFGGGILLVLGLFTRPAALLLFAQMMVALFFVHLRMTGSMSTFAEGYSHALEDGIVFLGLVFLGAGKYSIDRPLFCRNRDKAR
jgi:putative oxidoreductase